MPKKPVTSTDELARMLLQAEANMSEALMQQMLGWLEQQTFVGGNRVAIQKLVMVLPCSGHDVPIMIRDEIDPLPDNM